MSRTDPKKMFRVMVIIAGSILFGSFLFAGFYPWVYKQFNYEPILVKYSPDKRFKIEYHSIPFLPFRPHYYTGIGCTDCPGYVRLIDNSNETILQEKYFHTRHEVSSGIDWKKQEVSMKLFANWRLPNQSMESINGIRFD